MIAMTSADQVRRVLLDAQRDLVVEEQPDGAAVVRDPQVVLASSDGRGFPVSDSLTYCANILADSGFAIALVRDQQGVYLNAR